MKTTLGFFFSVFWSIVVKAVNRRTKRPNCNLSIFKQCFWVQGQAAGTCQSPASISQPLTQVNNGTSTTLNPDQPSAKQGDMQLHPWVKTEDCIQLKGTKLLNIVCGTNYQENNEKVVICFPLYSTPDYLRYFMWAWWGGMLWLWLVSGVEVVFVWLPFFFLFFFHRWQNWNIKRTEGIIGLQYRAFTVTFQGQCNGFRSFHIHHKLRNQVSITDFTQERH